MSVVEQTRAQLEQAAYGWSLLVDDGDLVMDSGRLRTVSGEANLEQSLLLRIATPWGDDRLSADYGIDMSHAFTVGLTRALAKQVLKLNLIRTLASDPRVAGVAQLLFDDDPEYLSAHPGAMSTTARRVALAEISVHPVSPAPAAVDAVTAALLSAGRDPHTLSFVAEVEW